MSEYGRVYSVETKRAGGNLDGDHAASASSLDIALGFEFDEDGGQCIIAGQTLTYTSADFPDPADEDDDIPVVLHLDGTLGVDVEDGAFVEAVPGGQDTYATVEVTGQGTPVVALVRHELIPYLADGIRGDASEAETVLVNQDAFGDWTVVDVVGRAPVMDGGVIDPDTMPPAAPPADVEPPAVSKPTLSALGIGALRASWTPVTNPTPVMYEVWAATSTGQIEIDNGILLGTTAASQWTMSDYNGNPLGEGTNYYVGVKAFSGSESADMSPESDPAQVVVVDLSELDELRDKFPITETDIADDAISTPKLQANSVVTEHLVAGAVDADKIAANSVNAGHISANSIDGEKLTAEIILASDIATAASGERTGISAERGLYSEGPDGEEVLRAQGGNVRVAGEIEASALSVTGGANWSGENVGAPGASTMMADRLNPPGNAPTVGLRPETITLDGGDIAGDDDTWRSGLVWYDNHWWVASTPGPSDPRVCLLKFDANGGFVSRTLGASGFGYWIPNGLAVIGSTFYVSVYADNRLHVFHSDGSTSASTRLDAAQNLERTMGSDGTYLVRVWRDDNNNCRWQRYNPSTGAKVGAEVNTGSNINPMAMISGSFDFGSKRYVIAGPNYTSVLSTSGVNDLNYRFRTSGAKGITWDGSNFYTLQEGRIVKHTGALLGQGPDVPLYVSSTWYDANPSGGTHETSQSPMKERTFYQRGRHAIRTSAPVQGPGGVDDPNGARFYVGWSASRTRMELQGVDSPGVGQFAEVGLDDLTLPSVSGSASNPPPASGNFPTSTPYEHYSQATIPGTSDPQTSIKGDGSARLWALTFPRTSRYRANDLNIPAGSATAVAIGSVLEEDTDVFTYNSPNITVNYSGHYEITLQIAWDNATGSNNYCAANLFVNGTSRINATESAPSYTNCFASKELYLNAGDVLHVEAYQNSGSPRAIRGGENYTYIQLKRTGA